MSPRIYVYKITFEETRDWYWGVHKEAKFGEFYMGSPVTHAWKWEFYTPVKQIVQLFDYTKEGFKEARKLEDRLILPDLRNPLCLNESTGGRYSLDSCALGGKAASEILHSEKTTDGKSVQAVAGGIASGKIWTEAKIESSKQNLKKATQCQKERKIQIYGDDWEYYRRKGRLTRFGVKIDGVRIPAKKLSETFIEYHLMYGQQKGGYENPHD
jgi:hypothetical protein